MLSVAFFYCYAECHNADCRYAECRSAWQVGAMQLKGKQANQNVPSFKARGHATNELNLGL
jgi:hypothetical protein